MENVVLEIDIIVSCSLGTLDTLTTRSTSLAQGAGRHESRHRCDRAASSLHESRQRCLQFQLRRFMRRPTSEITSCSARTAPIAQCKSSSYMCCCDFRVLCDCSQGSAASGQREEASYAFCCSASTPCDCSAPPLNVTV